MARQILYLSHGGGPLPLLQDPDHQELTQTLQDLGKTLSRPKAILVVSAHWESSTPRITAGPRPELIYDYSGFPLESYHLSYPAPGSPELAKEISKRLESAGFHPQLDSSRGFDHGLFVPLMLMFPEAEIPALQLSLLSSLDAKEHLALGAALRDLPAEDLLVVGSGFSFHNMRAFFQPSPGGRDTQNLAFEAWLQETLGDPGLLEAERQDRLLQWERAPAARYCHPREEHLLPLHVCYGMAQRAADSTISLSVLKKDASMFLWNLEEG